MLGPTRGVSLTDGVCGIVELLGGGIQNFHLLKGGILKDRFSSHSSGKTKFESLFCIFFGKPIKFRGLKSSSNFNRAD